MLNSYNHRQVARFVLKNAISVRAGGAFKGMRTYVAVMCDETIVHIMRYKGKLTIQYISID